MEKRPAVSVIIPVYNTEAYLAECLDSVANQTLRDIEIICVDDGSTDDSLRILASCAKSDERIRIFSKCNGGISSARNLGLDYARGEYVFFLDSDDMLSVQALQELTQIAERRRTDILYSDSAPFFETAELEDRYHDWIARGRRSQEYCGVVTGGELFAEMSLHDDYRAPSTRALYRRAYLVEKGLRFYEGIVHEDELFTLISMLEASAVSHVRKAYYQRRVRGDSVMTSGLTYRSFQGYFIVYAELMRYALSHTFEERIQSRLWNRIMTIRKNAFAKYDQLPKEEQKGITWTNDPYVLALFRMSEHAALQKKTKALESAQKELAHMKQDRAIRLWLKIKGGLKCLKENGAAYTCRRICQKVKRRAARR